MRFCAPQDGVLYCTKPDHFSEVYMYVVNGARNDNCATRGGATRCTAVLQYVSIQRCFCSRIVASSATSEPFSARDLKMQTDAQGTGSVHILVGERPFRRCGGSLCRIIELVHLLPRLFPCRCTHGMYAQHL